MNNNLSTWKLRSRIALLLVVSIFNFVAAPLFIGNSTKAESLKPFVPTPTSSPSPVPEPSPSPPYIPTFIRRVNLQANNLVYSQATQALYASVQSRDGSRGNSITRITPATGEIGPSVFIGSNPDRMAISDDGRTIWTHLNGVNVVRQFDVLTETAGLQFFSGSMTPQPPLDMDVVPGHPLSVVLSRGFSQDSAGSVVVFDSGIKRPHIANTSSYGPVEFGADPSILYGAFGGGLIKFLVDSYGVTQSSVSEGFWPPNVSSFKFAGGLLYGSTGAVVDPESNVLRGKFQGVNSSSAMAVDIANHRVFYVTGSGSGVVLQAFDSDTFLPIGSQTLPGVTGAPVSLVRWGTNGLAFNTAPSFNSADPNQVYIVQTEFVSNVDPIPTGIQVENGFPFTSEDSSTVPIKVFRTGDVSGSVSVNYATSDVTATAGLDYTVTSGTLNFGPGELTKFISIPIINDNLFEDGNEMFNLTLSGPTNSAILMTPAGATVFILENDSKPIVTFPSQPELTASYVVEGDSDMNNLSFHVFLTNPSVQDITVDYATADVNGSCKAGTDYVASSGTIRIPAGTTSVEASIPIIGDTAVEESEVFRILLSNATNVSAIGTPDHYGVIENDDASMQLSGTTFNVNEEAGFAAVTVVRVGDLTRTASVLYSTTDTAGLQDCTLANGKASERCDYGTAVGRIQFPIKEYTRFGEARETFIVPIVDDALVEGDETFTVNLSAPTGAQPGGVLYSPTGVFLGGATTATITITDNDSVPVAQNPIDGVNFFVTQQYIDFLSRLPDTIGLANWTNTLENCPNGGFGEFDNPSCDRVHVSAGFFLSDEFRGRGYFAYKFYEVGLDRRPSYAEFVPDMAQIGGPQSPESELISKAAYTDTFAQRQEFKNRYDALSNTAYVAALETNAEVTLTDKAGLVAALNANRKTRAQVLREIVESQSVTDKFFIRAFVVMQYFGYLRRDPDTIGYDNWVNTLTGDSSNFRHVIFGFTYSDEYRRRFGP